MSNEEIQDDGQWVSIDLDSIDDGDDNDDNENQEEDLELKEEEGADPDSQIEYEDSDGGGSEEEEEEEEKDEKEKPKNTKKGKSRSEERIHQLVAQKKELEQKLQEQASQLEKAKASNATTKQESFKSQKTLIQDQIGNIKKALKTAIEDGDVETQLDLNEKLSDLKLDLRVVDAKLNNVPESDKGTSSENDVKKDEVQIPETMRFWLEDNPWALQPETKEDRKKVRFIRKASKDLLNEGYTEDDPDFYDELDERIEQEFKNSFGKSGSDGVDLESDGEESSSRTKNAQENNSSPAKAIQTQTVAGSSRTPAAARKSKKVKLTKDEKLAARKLGISENAYARRKLEKEQTQSGWTTIA